MTSINAYTKQALRPPDLITHLKAKGLNIPDTLAAERSFESIGYYRLLIYMRPLQNSDKQFLPNSQFHEIIDLYEFDRKLRLLCMDAIERIEVALRSSLVNGLAVPYGPHFYADGNHYGHPKGLSNFSKKADEAKYLAISHYKGKYKYPKEPPIWAVLEAVTFGTISTLFADLSVSNRKLVSQTFGFDETILVSWFRTLAVLRNMCAHHNRIWNFTFSVNQPKFAKSIAPVFAKPDTFHARAVILVALLQKIYPKSDWRQRLVNLIKQAPSKATPVAMGFPDNWEADSFWAI